MATGVRKRHSKGCRARDGGRCNCEAGYEAWLFLNREGKKVSKTFRSEAEAKAWHSDAQAAASRGGLRAPTKTTISEAWNAWLRGAKDGTICNRSGDPFKPSALRSYAGAMRREVLPAFGAVRLSDLRRADLQAFA